MIKYTHTIKNYETNKMGITHRSNYIRFMEEARLENVGMLSTTPIEFNGQQIMPIQFRKSLLPSLATLEPRTVGKTNIRDYSFDLEVIGKDRFSWGLFRDKRPEIYKIISER